MTDLPFDFAQGLGLIDGLQLLRPLWLVALVPMLIVWWGLWKHQDAGGSLRKFIDPQLLEHLLVGRGQQKRFRPIHGLLMVWVLAVVALVGPSWKLEPSPFADDEAGLFVLLKVSGTMEATDLQPTRLERAKLKLRDLLALREGASTGLIVYSGSAHLVMPLTRDSSIITSMIEDLTPDLMPVEGDALAEAIALASRMLERVGAPGSLLVMADSVSASQAKSVAALQALPVQFYAIRSPGARLDVGMDRAADALGASITPLTVDDTDVERIVRRAETRIAAAAAEGAVERRHDSGRAIVPLIALVALLWSRKGWVVR